MRWRYALAALLCCLILILCRSAFAQEESEPLREAKALFHRGVALLEAGDPERALEMFTRSRALVPSVQNTVNTAICLERLGRYDEALDVYDDVVARFAAELDEQDRASLGPVVAELQQKIGYVRLSSNVGGAVAVDGRWRAELPLRGPLRVLPGTRNLSVDKAGYRSFAQPIDIAAGQSVALDVRLEPSPEPGAHPPGAWAKPTFIAGSALALVGGATIVATTLLLPHQRDLLAQNCVVRDGDDCTYTTPAKQPAAQDAADQIATYRNLRWVAIAGTAIGVGAATVALFELLRGKKHDGATRRIGVMVSRRELFAEWQTDF